MLCQKWQGISIYLIFIVVKYNIMINPSNSYAEKIFSEHPLALWALDDKSDYISLIDPSEVNLVSWTATGVDAPVAWDITFQDEPSLDSPVNKIVGMLPVGAVGQVKLVSQDINNFSQLSEDMETFSIGMFAYSTHEYITSYDIGYEYTNPLTSTVVEKVTNYLTGISNKWVFISDTFDIVDAPLNFRIVFKINYRNAGAIPEGYTFYTNGLSVGQWSEEFSATSTGVTPVQIPNNIMSVSGYGIEAKAYGLNSASSGYYMADSDGRKLLAKNTNVPMVFGASGITEITPHSTEGAPSLIIPGYGFLNEFGKYKNFTVEMWLRVKSSATESRRIFGPVNSLSDFGDGIYVSGPFIKIKVGDNIGTHFVGDWSRPMLLDFKVGDGIAGLMINGDQVISMPLNTESIDFNPRTVIDGGIEKSNDWLGFYAYSDVDRIEIDCVAIYSYQVSSTLAKRRFAYGQAVDFPENSNTAFGGTSTFIDYPFAEYTNNYSYPDIGKFGQGIVENLSVDSGSISSPNYQLPELVLKDATATESEWKAFNFLVWEGSYLDDPDYVAPFIRTSPSVVSDGYLYLERLNPLTKNLRGIYGLFQINDLSSDDQVLFRIENNINGNYFSAVLNGETVSYYLKYGSDSEQLLYIESGITAFSIFFAGVDIESIVDYFGRNVASFFGNRSQLEIYIGSDKAFENPFLGNLYKFGFCSEKNFKKISSVFNNDFSKQSTADAGGDYFGEASSHWSSILDGGVSSSFMVSDAFLHTASYTIIPKIAFGNFSLDIAIDSYWEDYLPLTYFAQYVSDEFGNKYYDLDFIQFNTGYPNIVHQESPSVDAYKTSVRTFVTFRFDLDKNINYENTYVNTATMTDNKVVSPGTHVIGYTQGIDPQPIYDDFMNTKYEVTDGSIIYPPYGVNIEKMSMATHIDIVVDGIKSNPIRIKTLQYASEAFNSVVPNPIGTRFGNKIYPYIKYGAYYDYKSRNPFRIYKGSTPYLYLTDSSGIEKVDPYNPRIDSGLAIPVNSNLSSQYKAIAMQLAIKYKQSRFPESAMQIFEIESKDAHIKFYLVANDTSGKRGRIYAINAKTGKFENGIALYVNGKVVRDAVISLNCWALFGIGFSNQLDFNSFQGAIRITGNILTNMISVYKSTTLQELQRTSYRSWNGVVYSPFGSLFWGQWTNAFNWNGVLVAASSEFFGIDPANIYKTYTGTNKIIVDDDRPLTLYGYEYGMYEYKPTQTQIIDPV